ncbi:MAG: carbohydrate-binding domain-containing protein [Oscillospiraceae bacterium]|nr:carbohydrate-binding domain-containing protein [Oscillospiraceae bacterium]
MKRIFASLLVLTLAVCLFAGCGQKKQPDTPNANNNGTSAGDSNQNTNDTTDTNTNANPVEVDFSKTDGDMFTDRDRKTAYDANKAVAIRLNGNSATASSDSVKISGSKVTITEEATYVISGELTDGMLIVDADDKDKVQLVFAGVNIISKTSAALYVLEADKVFVTLAAGTENTLANGGSFTAIDDDNIDGALFSKQDLTLNGAGALTVTSPAGHGIVCKDDLVITGGNYVVNAASHGLDANDSVRITGAAINIDAGKDAIHAENDEDAVKGFVYISGGAVKGESEGDGISAGAYMQIADGTIDLLVGGGSENGEKEHSDSFGGFMGGGQGGMRPRQTQTSTTQSGTSMKGLKATTGLLVSGGNITVDSADDALHSDASLIINGGTFTLASGDDAIHAEETLTVTAGKIDISASYEGLEALHIDIQGGNIKLKATDDGLNAAGGTDQSGATGGRDGMFGGGKPGGMGGFGGMSANSGGSIKISGGTIYINASGDGIDANGTLEISGGHTTVTGPTQGDTATLDYDKTGVITGGTFIGTGSTMMAQGFSDSAQGVIAINAGNQGANTQITLKDAKGNVIISHKPELDFAVVILSTPELVKGETYTIAVGSRSGEVEAN